MQPRFNHWMHCWTTVTWICLAIVVPSIFADRAVAQFSQGTSGGSRNLSKPANGLGDRMPESSASKQTIPNIVLREGTLIGPIRGRCVLRGQRWWFIVKEGAQADRSQLAAMIDTGAARNITETRSTILKRKTTVVRSRASSQSSNERRIVEEGGVGQVPLENQAQRHVPTPPFESMIVVENLMLDRIAAAIGEDPADDHWTITGRITEFQDDNRLILATAHRTVASIQR